jgi:hypothetical protein
MAALRDLAAEKSRDFRGSFVGRWLPAITLHTPASLAAQGRTSALTDNYLPLELLHRLPSNQLVHVRVNAVNAAGGLVGEIQPSVGNMAAAS